MAWSTRTAAIAELRVQMQDAASPQRYTDAELGAGLDSAVEALSALRPFILVVNAVVPSDRIVRLDNLVTGVVYKSLVSIVNISSVPPEVVVSSSYFEASAQHKLLLAAAVPVGDTVALTIRGGYGFAVAFVSGSTSGVADTNIPPEWRDRLLQGAEGYVLDLYGAREVGRSNVAPAVQQQTARAAQLKLRDFAQWLNALPYRDAGRQVVEWGLATVDEGAAAHRGFG